MVRPVSHSNPYSDAGLPQYTNLNKTPTPAPGKHTTPSPGNHTTPAPGNHTTPAPGNHTTPAPGNHTTPAPNPKGENKDGKPQTDNSKGLATGEGIDTSSPRPDSTKFPQQAAAWDQKDAQEQRFEAKKDRILAKQESEIAKILANADSKARTWDQI